MGIPAPASTAEALDMVLAGLSYLAAADPTVLAAQAQAECLQTLEQADAIATAARARILAAFTAGQGYAEDADYSPTSWLIHRTRITKAAARGHLGWARRAAAHPQVVAALAEGTVLSESMARADLRVDRQAARVLPGRRRRHPGRRGAGRGPQGGPGRPGRGDLRPVPARGPRMTRNRASRTASCGSRPRSPARASSPGTSPRSAPRW